MGVFNLLIRYTENCHCNNIIAKSDIIIIKIRTLLYTMLSCYISGCFQPADTLYRKLSLQQYYCQIDCHGYSYDNVNHLIDCVLNINCH